MKKKTNLHRICTFHTPEVTYTITTQIGAIHLGHQALLVFQNSTFCVHFHFYVHNLPLPDLPNLG